MPHAHTLENPYPGLRPFRADEDNLFFGREGQSEAIVRRLRENRFLAVVGVSGSGKSSLIRAGLMAFLDRGHMKGASSRWRATIFRPGSDPIGNMAAALNEPTTLGKADRSEDDIRTDEILLEVTLRRSGLGLIDAVELARLPDEERVLIIVDQFEELFRFADAPGTLRNEEDAAAFIRLLVEATGQSRVPIYVVITMRSEFIGDCARYRDLPEAVTAGLYLIPRLTRDQRRDVIGKPAQLAGARIAPRLMNRLLNDCGDDPGQLPSLQHALMRTWSFWHKRGASGDIELNDYLEIGSMTDALSRHADEAYEDLPDGKPRYVARRLFQSLVERDADNREVRRPTKISNIAEISGACEDEVIHTVEYFRREDRSFLMPPPEVKLDGDAVVDISHESLIRGWKQLGQWVDEESESAQSYRKLSERAEDAARGKAGYLRDPELQFLLNWRDERAPNAAWAKRYGGSFEQAVIFLEASRTASDAERAQEERHRKKELHRVWFFAVVATSLFVMAAVMFWDARRQAGRAMQDEAATASALRIAEIQKGRAEHAERDAKNSLKQARTSEREANESADQARNMFQAAKIAERKAQENARKAEEAVDRAAKASGVGIDAFSALPTFLQGESDVNSAYESRASEAIEQLSADLSLNPGSREALHYLADNRLTLTYLHRNKAERADVEKWGLQLASKESDYFSRVLGASVLARLGSQEAAGKDTDAAQRDVQKAIEAADAAGEPPDRNDSAGDLSWRLRANAYYIAGNVKESSGEADAAVRLYQKAVETLKSYQKGISGAEPRKLTDSRSVKLLVSAANRLTALQKKDSKETKQVFAEYTEAAESAERWLSDHEKNAQTDQDLVSNLVWLYIYRADTHKSLGEFPEALHNLEMARRAGARLNERTYSGWYDKSAVNERLGNLYYWRAIGDAKDRTDYLSRAIDFHMQALKARELAYTQGLRFAREALPVREKALSEGQLGNDYWVLGKNSEALQHFKLQVDYYRMAQAFSLTDEMELTFAEACGNLADNEPKLERENAEFRARNYQDAVDAIDRMAKPKADVKAREIKYLHQLGELQNRLGSQAKAIATYQKAIALLEQQDTRDPNAGTTEASKTMTLFQLHIETGDVEVARGNYDAAEKSFVSGQRMAERLGVEEGGYQLAVADERQGNLAYARAALPTQDKAQQVKAWERAAEFHQRSLSRFVAIDKTKSASTPTDRAASKRSVGLDSYLLHRDYLALRDYARAREYANRSLEAYKEAQGAKPSESEVVSVATAYQVLGSLALEERDQAGVRANCELAINTLRPLADAPRAGAQSKAALAGILGGCSWWRFLTSDFRGALSDAQDGLRYDSTQRFLRMNEAHAYLGLGQVDAARKLYFEDPDRPLEGNSGRTFRQVVLEDFEEIRKHPELGFLQNEVARIEGELRAGAPSPGKAADRNAIAAAGPVHQ